jgi:hypothetical protein
MVSPPRSKYLSLSNIPDLLFEAGYLDHRRIRCDIHVCSEYPLYVGY